MKRNSIFKVIVALIVFFTEGIALSFDQEDILIHGFMSQGYLKSTHNNYLGNSKDGSFEFNEIGLNFAMPLSDELRFGLQIFSRDIGEYSNNEVTVDWGFLDYHMKDWLGFRAGKIKMPFGLYNRQRDADTLRTPIFLPQSVYPEGIREFIIAFYGASIYGSSEIGSAGSIDYEVFAGTLDIDADTPFVSNILSTVVLSLEAQGIDLAAAMDAFGIDLTEVDIEVAISHIEGAMLVWNTPLSGLRFSGTYLSGSGDLSLAGGALDADLSLDAISVLSVEYEKGPVILACEYFDMDTDIVMRPFGTAPMEIEGWYISASWQVKDWLELGAAYGEYYPTPEDKDGSDFEAVGLPDYYAWQKDTTLSVRFNLSEYWTAKFETHFMDGAGACSPSDNPNGIKDDWILYAVKTSLYF